MPSVTLHVKSGGARHALTFRVTRGVSLVPAKTLAKGKSSRAQVRLKIAVTRSKVPGCPNGSTGTLIVTTAPSALLKVCSRSFLQGPASATIAEL